MQKAKSLRDALAAALPDLANEKDRLRIWVEDGAGISRQTESFGFAFKYRLNVLLVETSTDIAIIALAVFRWLRVNQPDLLAPGAEGFAFDADMLDNATADILLRLDLMENVLVAPREDGGHGLEYLTEPDPMLPDGFDETPPPDIPLLTEVTVTSDPA